MLSWLFNILTSDTRIVVLHFYNHFSKSSKNKSFPKSFNILIMFLPANINSFCKNIFLKNAFSASYSLPVSFMSMQRRIQRFTLCILRLPPLNWSLIKLPFCHINFSSLVGWWFGAYEEKSKTFSFHVDVVTFFSTSIHIHQLKFNLTSCII